jgi:FkbM family methyltransferase
MSRVEADRAYSQIVPVGIRLCRDWFGLKIIEFMPWDSSPLKVGADSDHLGPTVKLVADYLMCPIVLGRHRWQIEELDFAKRVCIGAEPITLVDVGANMGLFSRQLVVAIPAIAKVFAYEPEPNNFGCLVHNLEPFRERVVAIQAAISNNSGNMEFYLDPTNSGNFSLAVDAMPPSYTKMIVETKNVALESTERPKNHHRAADDDHGIEHRRVHMDRQARDDQLGEERAGKGDDPDQQRDRDHLASARRRARTPRA